MVAGNRTRPVAGLRVVEVANFLAAPIACALMADMGADVIKIEPPGGDTTRNLRQRAAAPPVPNHGFHALNRGKRSITVDLTRPGATEVVYRLVEGADLFVTNLMTVRLERFGLTYELIRSRSPAIVFAQITGWGSSGRRSQPPRVRFNLLLGPIGVDGTDGRWRDAGGGEPRRLGRLSGGTSAPDRHLDGAASARSERRVAACRCDVAAGRSLVDGDGGAADPEQSSLHGQALRPD